jgi:hypothetical protein
MPMRLVVGVILLSILGCGGSQKLAPVSGKVTLDGKPLANALVSFQPIAEKASLEGAPGSSGKTNDQGEFTLMSIKGGNGAWVGKHRVFVSLVTAKAEQTGDRRGGPAMEDKVPSKYNGFGGQTVLTFDVPPEGTTKADFALTSR